jgi:electron transfer flavoprotein alpha subunit
MSADNNIKRINPRRPYQITAAGIKRIVLGATDGFVSHEGHKAATHHGSAKPLRTPANPKAHVLVIAHSDRGMLDDHARQAIAAAAILADADTAVVALVLGELREDLASAGADQVIVIPELDFQRFQPDIELACVATVIEAIQPTRIFMPDNLSGDGDLGRRLIASRHAKSAATQVVEIDAEHIASYQAGGTMLAFGAVPDIVLLAPDTVDARLPFTAAAQLDEQSLANLVNSGAYQDLGMQTIAAAQIALEEADFIVSAGNGVNHVATLETLALSLDAAIGASRVAVDDGKFTRDKQIGATGKTVSASAYLAIGISGAVQHLQGIKDCRHVIVINRDNSAPIVKRADLSVIGDAEEIMRDLISAIAEAKSSLTNISPAMQEAA